MQWTTSLHPEQRASLRRSAALPRSLLPCFSRGAGFAPLWAGSGALLWSCSVGTPAGCQLQRPSSSGSHFGSLPSCRCAGASQAPAAASSSSQPGKARRPRQPCHLTLPPLAKAWFGNCPPLFNPPRLPPALLWRRAERALRSLRQQLAGGLSAAQLPSRSGSSGKSQKTDHWFSQLFYSFHPSAEIDDSFHNFSLASADPWKLKTVSTICWQ